MGAGGKEGRTELMDDEEEEPEFWVGRVGGGGGVVMDLDAFLMLGVDWSTPDP